MQTASVIRGRLYLLGWVLAVAGCDAQVAVHYPGESLLTLHGNVLVPASAPEGPLVPALAFPGVGSEFEVIDVAVRGDFPANFRIDVYEPPPFAAFSSFPDEPSAALGFITAVVPNEGEKIRYAALTTRTAPVCTEPEGCAQTSTWCADDGDCYQEVRICPKLDSAPSDCHVESEGDSRLKLSRWGQFAGFSQNYAVMFLDSPASAESRIARTLAAPQGLDAGYHLIEVRATTGEEQASAVACARRVDESALAEVNEARGTDYTYEEAYGAVCVTCTGVCEEASNSRLCDLSSEARAEFDTQLGQQVNELEHSAKCPPLDRVFTRVSEPNAKRIAVRLGAESTLLNP